MELGNINSSSAANGIGNLQDVQGTQKTSMFAGMKIGAGTGNQNQSMDVNSNVERHGITQGGEVDKAQETQATQSPTGIFGKLKIGQGGGSMKSMGTGGNISGHSLNDRVGGGS